MTPASAYCRTTTCDVDLASPDCSWDLAGCALSGIPLSWENRCGWFGIQKDGSKKLGISHDTLHAAVVSAFSKWSQADCGGGATPAFSMTDTDALYGPVECKTPEFNLAAANASAWMFRDDDWPYVGANTTIALTTLSVQLSTGRILDADVEINSFGRNITTSDVNVGEDLDSIVTHEAGHFLGLAHSAVPSATMFANYTGISARSLAPDDEAGLCAAYPPASPPACGQPEPVYGFSRYCKGVNPDTEPESPEPTAGPDGGASSSSDGTGGHSSSNPTSAPGKSSVSGGCSVERRDAAHVPASPLAWTLAAALAVFTRKMRRSAVRR